MSEVTEEVQAQMAIKLAENVRELIRKEMLEAFASYEFAAAYRTGPTYNFTQAMATQLNMQPEMQNIVKQTIIQQMNKY